MADRPRPRSTAKSALAIALVAAIAGMGSCFESYFVVQDHVAHSPPNTTHPAIYLLPLGLGALVTVIAYLALPRLASLVAGPQPDRATSWIITSSSSTPSEQGDAPRPRPPFAIFGSILAVGAGIGFLFAGYLSALMRHDSFLALEWIPDVIGGAMIGAILGLPVAIVTAVSLWLIGRRRG